MPLTKVKTTTAPAVEAPAAPSRATGKFTLTMGLLSVPVDVFTSTEDISVKREQFLATGEKVGSSPAVKNEDGTYGRLVERSEIVKKFATSAGLVDLSDDEIDTLSTAQAGTADVLAVLPLGLIGTRYVANGKVWQARAGKLGSGRSAVPNPGGEQAYSLLLAGLAAKESFMLIRWSRAGALYLSALLPSGRLVGLFHDNEVRADRALPLSDHSADEVGMAVALLDAFAESTPVTVVNDIPAKVTAYAEAKATTGEVVALPVAPKAVASGTIDLMGALRASVEAARAAKASA